MDTETAWWDQIDLPVTDRVARGAALLDQAYVNRDVAWWDQIDLDRLDMYSSAWCVLAQTTGRYESDHPCWCGEEGCLDPKPGSYVDGIAVLGLPHDQSGAYGFTVGPEGHQALREAWRELILARRETRDSVLAELVEDDTVE